MMQSVDDVEPELEVVWVASGQRVQGGPPPEVLYNPLGQMHTEEPAVD